MSYIEGYLVSILMIRTSAAVQAARHAAVRCSFENYSPLAVKWFDTIWSEIAKMRVVFLHTKMISRNMIRMDWNKTQRRLSAAWRKKFVVPRSKIHKIKHILHSERRNHRGTQLNAWFGANSPPKRASTTQFMTHNALNAVFFTHKAANSTVLNG